ncbi:MAG: prolipoprotein diacylglyceryl transferase [Gammaproteobacteria bacterium]|nr:prolipoprotein diacylglyceryl transferase [Gammaproteobacteria bacterium]
MIPPALLVWNVDPIALKLGPLAVHWYGILFASGFIIGYYLFLDMLKREQRTQMDVDRLLTYLMVGTVVGARVVHCVFYDPAYYLSHPLDILKIWEGGLASHGGGLGVLVAVYLYSRRVEALDVAWLIDRLAPLTILAGALIRMGNFVNSEIVGRPTDVAWAIIFPRVDMLPRHPAQLYEALSYLCIFIWLYFAYRRRAQYLTSGALFGRFLVAVFSVRIAVEFVKAPQAAFEDGNLISMGQLLSVPFLLAGIYILMRPAAWQTLTQRLSPVAVTAGKGKKRD